MAATKPYFRILIVEDNALLRMGTVAMLEEAGYRVVDAANSREAIGIMECCDDVALMFTDVDMPPGMSGLQLGEVVRERWPQIKLLITSGHHQLITTELPGDSQFLPKPYSRKTVVKAINQLLQ